MLLDLDKKITQEVKKGSIIENNYGLNNDGLNNGEFNNGHKTEIIPNCLMKLEN